MAGNRQRVRQAFMEIADLPAADREAALIDACEGDAMLRSEVEALLRADARANGFMVSPTADAVCAHWDAASAMPREQPGQMIGRYRLLEPIGEGGFGSVWMAEQREPIKRRVAIKIIKMGMDTKQVIARFEAERQALAMMDHPNIAKVLDAGATEAGRPYFVMEYIKGVPIVEYCDINKLDTKARLELFTSVCNAIQHAHTKGIIHRDIKPSNVLVTMHDGVPVPKVIDFGIAKATNSELTQRTLFTEHRQMIGTPAYMSPEQAELSGLDIDTRSDIYSLGVLLYELLTGTTPFGHEELMSKGFAEMMRIIREVEPHPPSTRISSLGDAGTRMAQQRHAGDAKRLGLMLRGDLDWIVMKSLEKDRTRRYESASALAADVQCHLTGEPVVAAPPSRTYRLSRTLRRHRTAAAVATGFVVLIAFGLVATSTLWRQAAHARDAESDQRARAEAINTFLKNMLTAAEPAHAKGEKLTIREALDTAAKSIEQGSVQDRPLVEAEIRFTIGSTYLALGLCPEAELHLRAADAIQSRELGGEHRDTLRTRFKLARALSTESDYAEAIALARPTFEAQSRVLGLDDPDTLKSMVLLGSVLWAQVGRFAEAESMLLSAIERLERVQGPNHPDTAKAMDSLGELYGLNSYPKKAEPLHREALRIHTEELGEEHPATLNSMFHLAISLHNQQRLEESAALNRRVMELRRRVLGPEHMDTLIARGNLANSLNRLGRHSEAETMHRENLAALLQTAGPTHSNTITEKRYLAGCLGDQGKYPEAEILLREALDAAREKYGPEDADTSIRLMCGLTSVLAIQHKDIEAEQVARQVLEFQRRQLPRPEPSALTQSSLALIQVLKRRGAIEEALRTEQELIKFWLAAAHDPAASENLLDGAARRLLNPSNEQLRDAPQALELALLAIERSGERNPRHLNTLAKACMLTGDPARATQVWKEAIALLPDDHARAAMLNGAAWELLTLTPETLRDPAAALEFALMTNELSGYENSAYLDTLALAHFRMGDALKAIEFQRQALELLPQDSLQRSEYEGRLSEFEAPPKSAPPEETVP